MNIFIVIPTIRSLGFLRTWKEEFSNCHLVVVEDHQEREIETPKRGFLSVHHYDWRDIKKDFGRDEWIFPRQNAGIRSYGFWKAYMKGADVIITLDDDCYPAEDRFVQKHIHNLQSGVPTKWYPTFPHPDYMYTRGFPYEARNRHRVVISHGLWSNKMDMDAKTQMCTGKVNVKPYPPLRQFVPFGYYFPMSSMNLAFTREAIPLMYFLLMGNNPEGASWGYDRYDDIWAGVFAKKITDHLGLGVVNGSPFVEHRKASDPVKNLKKEKTGMKENESLWQAVHAVSLKSTDVVSCYGELVEKVKFPDTEYFVYLRRAMSTWRGLFV